MPKKPELIVVIGANNTIFIGPELEDREVSHVFDVVVAALRRKGYRVGR